MCRVTICNNMANIANLRNLLAAHGQEHLLQFWDTLTNDEKNKLVHDINEIDIPMAQAGFCNAMVSYAETEVQISKNDLIEPIPKSSYGDVNKATADELRCYEELAFRMIGESKLAVLVLAGGQGTRLGISYPKGMYDVGLQSHKSLFQIQAERILRLEELSYKRTGQKGCITWLIMTGPSTTEPTLNFFKEHHYFGLRERNVIFFEQFTLPAFSLDGRIMLASRGEVAMSPDGNGGVFRALRDRRILNELGKRGVEYVHAYSVDNILVRVGDPLFVGYCAHHGSDCGFKIVEKTEPEEPIGVLCLVNGEWKVIEYSEIPSDTAGERTHDGSLLLNAGNICNHVFSLTFLHKITQSAEKNLKLHVAKKKIPTINERGEQVKPTAPNGFKLEKFIFDVCSFAEKLMVWKVNREEEFSALKNSDDVGKDCPATVRRDLYNIHRKWIVESGGKFTTTETECEISPLLSYAGEELEELVRGKIFSTPCYLKAGCECT